MWVVEDMVFPGVIKKIASGFSRGKISNMELKFPWGDKKKSSNFHQQQVPLFFFKVLKFLDNFEFDWCSAV